MGYSVDNFVESLDKLSVYLSKSQMNQFLAYYELLIEKNKVMNLTTITEFKEVVDKHFVDSLSITRVWDMNCGGQVLDLGTGAGFPGIPIKIAYPDTEITLVDSLQKRVNFLQEVIESLGLTAIRAVHARAEDFARQAEERERYDLCVSRAVANLSTLSEYCLPFVKTGGRFISYKSGNVEEELQNAETAIGLLGGKVIDVDKFRIGDNERTLVVIEKIKNSPKKYPRKAGTPSKNPL